MSDHDTIIIDEDENLEEVDLKQWKIRKKNTDGRFQGR